MSDTSEWEIDVQGRDELISRALHITRFTGLSIRIGMNSVFLCGDNGVSVSCIPKTEDPFEDLDNLFGSWIQLAQNLTCPTVQ